MTMRCQEHPVATNDRPRLTPLLYLLICLVALLHMTGCATTGGCPSGSEHQQFTERSSRMTVSRCQTAGKSVGPYQRLVNKKPRIVGQYADNGKPTGKWSRFDAKGKLIHEYSYDQQGRFHGDERLYLKGKRRTHVKWVHGKKQGQTCLYHTNGKKKSCGQYVDDKAHGPWPLWNEKGKLIFTNEYTHGFANKHMFYGDGYYSVSRPLDDGAVVSETHDYKTKKIIKRIIYKPCGKYLCRYSIEEYYLFDKKGKFIPKDTVQKHFIIDNKQHINIDQKTNKTTPGFCRESQLEPAVVRFIDRFNACKKYIYPTMERHLITFIITDRLSIYRLNLKYSSKGTDKTLERCLQKQVAKLASQTINMDRGICKIRWNIITTSPQKLEHMPDWRRPPSH